jgi:nucleoside-diphosphate-sugar epimerase
MSPDGDLQDHGRLARTAIAAAAAHNGRVLLASSAAVYGNQPGSLPETAALRPAAPYGQAKQEMEQIASDEADRLGVPLCLLRIGNIAGIDSILGGWKPGFQLDVLTDGHTPARSYIGPETLARVLGHLCITADLPRELNIATPGLTEMGALLDAADRPWTARPAPPGVIAAVHLDTTRLQQLVPLPSGASHPAQMVAEWQGLEPHMTR